MMLDRASAKVARFAFGAVLASAVMLLLTDAGSTATRQVNTAVSQSHLASICAEKGGRHEALA